jgi:hypothetical protein
MTLPGTRRLLGLGVLGTGVVCPCHALVGALALFTGSSWLTPAAQDGVHAVYVPLAILAGAVLVGRGASTRQPRPAPVERIDQAA